MSKFRKAVKHVAELYSLPEDVVADVFIDLLKNRTFSWRAI